MADTVRPEDQVLRRLRFEREHPEWFIEYRRDDHLWRAIEEGVNGAHVVVEHELRTLLDKLEAEYAPLT